MNPKLKEICALMEKMKGLYEQALHFGEECMKKGIVDYEELGDARHRILLQTQEIKEQVELAESQLGILVPSEQAYLAEHKKMIKDLLPKFQEQDLRMKRLFDSILRSKRQEMGDTNTNLRAARSYLGLSQTKVWH